MGSSWFVRPGSRRLTLSDGAWLLVKERLTAGEYRAHLKRSSAVQDDGKRRLDSLDLGPSLVIAYLIDWSLEMEAPIREMSAEALMGVLDTLDTERFQEVKAAIEAHDDAMIAEREREKNGTGGEKKLSAISPSPFAAAGASSGSGN